MSAQIVDHPLVAAGLAILRAKTTPKFLVSRLVRSMRMSFTSSESSLAISSPASTSDWFSELAMSSAILPEAFSETV